MPRVQASSDAARLCLTHLAARLVPSRVLHCCVSRRATRSTGGRCILRNMCSCVQSAHLRAPATSGTSSCTRCIPNRQRKILRVALAMAQFIAQQYMAMVVCMDSLRWEILRAARRLAANKGLYAHRLQGLCSPQGLFTVIALHPGDKRM